MKRPIDELRELLLQILDEADAAEPSTEPPPEAPKPKKQKPRRTRQPKVKP